MSCGREKAGGRTGAGKGRPPGAENARKEKTAPRSSSAVLILLFVWFLRQGRRFGGFQLLKLGLHGGIVFRQALD